MSTRLWLSALVSCLLATCLAAPAARADGPAVGAIVGVVSNAAKLPVAHATVTAVRVDGGAIRATVSGSDGVYSFGDLPPGAWSVSAQSEGYPEATTPPLQVNAGKATRYDFMMSGSLGAPPPASLVAAAPVTPVTPPPAAPSAPPAAGSVPEALQAPAPAPAVDTQTPFAVGDLGWMNGTPRETTPVFDTKFFTPEIRFDTSYLQ
ncbi:MAG: carboxypeptidase-like regulatory domain-containing protein, partial [Steroidobacteraceae bacterium]